MEFTKMQGAGNDFILINNISGEINGDTFGPVAKRLCSRRLSIGADGLMLIEKARRGADVKMLFFNADGTNGEMCGNGARCICRYVYENGLSDETQTIETMAGIVTGKRIDKRIYQVRLNDISKLIFDVDINVGGKDYKVDYLEMGNPGLPHAIVQIDGLKDKDLDDLRVVGREIRYSDKFPKGVNVNFYDVIGEDEIQELTYERGVEDFTLACGTGTGCLVSALTLKGAVSGKCVRVHVRGGDLIISVKMNGDMIRDILLTGPTNYVCEGTIMDEDLTY